jgi:hypothetical protein
MLSYVVPAILDRFPASYLDRRRGVIIQQDGAGGHIKPTDEEWNTTINEMGLTDIIKLENQPSNSPDLNINDLGFFRSIECLVYKHRPKTKLELIQQVQSEYDKYSPSLLNRIWLTHQTVMNQILANRGCNDFKIPHMNKEKLEREGRLPKVLPVDEAIQDYR